MAIAMVAVIVFIAMTFIVVTFVAMAVMAVVFISVISVVPVSVSMGFNWMIVVPVIFVLTVVAVMIVVFRSGVFFVMLFAAFVSGMFLMAFFAAFLIALVGAIRHLMSMVLMLPDIVMLRIIADGVRMVIFVAIHPRPLPGRVVDEDHATVPGNAVVTPAPGTEGNANAHAEAEADCRPDEDPGTRTLIDHDRIVGRDINVVGPRRHDGDIRTAGHHDLRTAAQISVVARALPHSLYRIHHFLLLAEKCVAYIFSPAHVRSHHVQHIRKGQQCLYRGVPGQLIAFNRCG